MPNLSFTCPLYKTVTAGDRPATQPANQQNLRAGVKIKFRGYKLSRMLSIFAFFLCFCAVFRIFWMKFRDLTGKVQFYRD